MKNSFMAIGLITFLALISVNRIYGGGGVYFAATLGNFGEAGAESFGGEMGLKWDKVQFGFGLVKIHTEGDWILVSSDGTSYTGVRLYRKQGAEYEGYGSIGISIFKNLFLVGTAGYSGETYEEKTESQYGTINLGSKDGTGYFSYSGQLQYSFYGIIVGAGYNNRRGIIGKIGFTVKW